MATERAASTKDGCTLANVEDFEYKHLMLYLAVDFEKSVLSGTATWSVVVKKHRVPHLILDTSSGLVVTEVTVCGHLVEHSFREPHAALGTALVVPVPDDFAEEDSLLEVKISYHTAPESSALQWLPPAQTAGKQYPYMFSQCQAIHARAMLPCPDAPNAKFTYYATVRVPAWATALMSAVPLGESGSAVVGGYASRTFKFEQEIPISSYLLALAVGELRGVEVGPRSTVWAEPSVVEGAAWEFADTEKFLATAEELTAHAYIWGRYDILCMPPSFPYGGMENPCLTFATPTLLAGDRIRTAALQPKTTGCTGPFPTVGFSDNRASALMTSRRDLAP